jgi:hypothetical protein
MSPVKPVRDGHPRYIDAILLFNRRWKIPAISITPSLPFLFSNSMPIETTILFKSRGQAVSLPSDNCGLHEHHRQVGIIIAEIYCILTPDNRMLLLAPCSFPRRPEGLLRRNNNHLKTEECNNVS